MIRKVHDGEISYTVADSLAYEINRHIYPNTRKAFNVSAPQALAWAFSDHGDGTLLQAANRFLKQYTESGQLDALKQQLFFKQSAFRPLILNNLDNLLMIAYPNSSQCLDKLQKSII